MSTVYQDGSDGPWLADDDAVFADGYFRSGIFTIGFPTIDGLERRTGSRPRFSGGGMVRNSDDHLTHGRDSHRRRP